MAKNQKPKRRSLESVEENGSAPEQPLPEPYIAASQEPDPKDPEKPKTRTHAFSVG